MTEKSLTADEEPSVHALPEIVVLPDQDVAGERWLSRVKSYKVERPLRNDFNTPIGQTSAVSADEEPSVHALPEIVVLQDQDFAGERWLSRVKNYKVELPGEVQDKDRVKIPKVSWEVTDKKLYEPEAVSIGPYHYNKDPKLRYVQELKVGFAHRFINGGMVAGSPSVTVEEVYGKVREVAGEARTYYSQDALGGMTDEEFTEVMFLDGCFVLEFVRWSPEIDFTEQYLPMDVILLRLVTRDLLLLDNQVPFTVLEALHSSSSSKTKSLAESLVNFLTSYSGITDNKFRYKTKTIHLLDFLSQCLYDPRDRPPRIIPGTRLMTCPNVTRLEEAGIDCWPAESSRFTAIRFTPKLFTAELKIPPVFIGELACHAMSYAVNLSAYQIYAAAAADEIKGTGAAEYIWLLDRLIDDSEDMRNLRAKQIIVHNLESDQQAVNLLKNISKNITNDMLGMATKFPEAYGRWVEKLPRERVLVQEIQDHLRSKFRRWGYKNVHRPYFRSAWSIPAFLAALVGLVLTFLQLYYAIYPPKKEKIESGHG